MKSFVSRVWTTLKDLGQIGIVKPDGEMDRNYLVGHNLFKDFRNCRIKIADRATGLSYSPQEEE